MAAVAWLIFFAAAVLEVGGDAAIRKGLRGSGLTLIAAGFAMLGSYGLVVNVVQWDFSKLLGVYVGVFAVVSVLCGRFVFGETVSASRRSCRRPPDGSDHVVARALRSPQSKPRRQNRPAARNVVANRRGDFGSPRAHRPERRFVRLGRRAAETKKPHA